MIMCKDDEKINKLEVTLSSRFRLKHLAIVKKFLGIQITNHEKGIRMAQFKYLD